ncbi:MAG TPA: ABC transporter substrate-binding protein [Microlunatus sp.]|nr:ABC transporter substrate-binding protein [Microlunatus sp.]
MTTIRCRAALAAALTVLALAACAPEDEAEPPADASASPSCTADQLPTLEPGTLTIGTDNPAYPPWFIDNDPSNGEGFESAVAYAVAEQLGFDREDVVWTQVRFDNAIAPGPKDFDFDINQFSITEERRQAVDFSSPYYDVRQAVIALADSPIAEATTLSELADVTLGAQVGTTSYQAIVEVVQPDREPAVFNTNDDAKAALENGSIDGLVVDLPTAFYMTSAEIENSVIVGQLPPLAEGEVEQFGLVLDKDSPLTECVSQAVDSLREDGTLAELEQQWLADVADAPELR